MWGIKIAERPVWRTIVPLEIFFNEREIAKLKIDLAQGKTFSNKREAIKKCDWQRDKARIMADYNSKKLADILGGEIPHFTFWCVHSAYMGEF